ncbi:MAG: carboxypeptidase regulatory-like domain-containing protein [Spirochaetes bacterium]|nr:carboxypeptidase regulatory-like domain-containing protein [Spirochaetota bacterium]
MKKSGVILLAALAALLFGCGREYHVRGRVVTMQAAASSITEVTGKEMPQTGMPVPGAEVTLFYELKEDGTPEAESTWKRSILTDDKGIFDLRDYSIPSVKLRVGLRVSREGYETAYTTYWDYKEIEPQVFLVQLAPAVR